MRAAVIVLAALAAPAQAADDPLAPLDFLVGSCWDGTFAGSGQKDVHCFTKMYGGKFVRDVHRVGSGAYGGESIYAWDAEAKSIAYTYYNADGGVSRGTAAASPGGLAFGDERFVGRDGKEIVMRSAWTREGADGYTAVTQQQAGDSWREVMRIMFRRLPGPPTAVRPE